jgi:hypothetical protein
MRGFLHLGKPYHAKIYQSSTGSSPELDRDLDKPLERTDEIIAVPAILENNAFTAPLLSSLAKVRTYLWNLLEAGSSAEEKPRARAKMLQLFDNIRRRLEDRDPVEMSHRNG